MSSEVKRHAGLDGREYVALDDYAALEAENARLVREAKNDAIAYKAVLERQDELRAERDAARARLAAIQGEMGEVVEVVARLMHWKGRHQNPWKVVARTYSECASYAYPKDWEEGAQLMTVAQHQRITAAMAAEVERLKGLTPELPPRPPEGEGLPRYGLRWNGPQQPLAVPMADGYWTPWHLADALRAELAEVKGHQN